MRDLTEALREAVLAAGIDLFGVTSADPLPSDCPEIFAHAQPQAVLPNARSVILAGFSISYEPRLAPSEPGKPRGRFTPYGSRVFSQMTDHCNKTVKDFLRRQGYKARAAWRLPVKPAVVRAGLGHYGKHSVVVTPELGSLVMFAPLVTDAPLAATVAPVAAGCPAGCRICLKACPTGAIVEPYKVDLGRCITHWLWGNHAPAPLREKQGTRLFGCAECLLACPKNAHIPPRQVFSIPTDAVNDSPELIPLLSMDESYFRAAIPTFPQQAGIDAMRGNAVIVLGNIGDPAAVPALGSVLRDRNKQIRAYSAWSLGRIGGPEAARLLETAQKEEKNKNVRREIEEALSGTAMSTSICGNAPGGTR